MDTGLQDTTDNEPRDRDRAAGGQPSGCEGDAVTAGERASEAAKWADTIEDELTVNEGVGV